MELRVRNPNNLFYGLSLVAFGSAGLIFGWRLAFGTMRRMGPGWLPDVISGALIALGIFLAVKSFTGEIVPVERWKIRPIIFILCSIALFATFIERLGMAVTVFIVVLLSVLASQNTIKLEMLLLAVGMAILCVILFVVILAVPVSIFPMGY